jgi:hypothetical protein
MTNENHKKQPRHGDSHAGLYCTWSSMLTRCGNKKASNYKFYGGRGITVCDEWRSYIQFKQWAMKNGYLDGLQIDRIDNKSGYTPANCRFVTTKNQARNRTTNRILCAFGEKKIVRDWINDDRCIVVESTFQDRVRRNWDIEKALSTPRRKYAIKRRQEDCG